MHELFLSNILVMTRTNTVIVKTKYKQNVGSRDYNSRNKVEITLTIKTNNIVVSQEDIVEHMGRLNISNFTVQTDDD